MPELAELDDVAAEEERDRPVDDHAELPRRAAGAGTGGTTASRTSRGSRAAAGRAPRRSPCAGRASRPGRASGSRTARASRSGSSRGAGPGAARAGTSADRARSLRVFGTRAQSPSAQTCSCPRTRRNSSTSTRPSRRAAATTRAAAGSRATPAVQTSVLVGIRVPSPSTALVGGDRLERRVDVDLDPALARARRAA